MNYAALKNLNKPGRSNPWSIMHLYPGCSKEETVEKLADFYNKLSGEFTNLRRSDLITTCEREITPITRESIVV